LISIAVPNLFSLISTSTHQIGDKFFLNFDPEEMIIREAHLFMNFLKKKQIMEVTKQTLEKEMTEVREAAACF
jgi:hypothetical protein